MLKEFKTIVDIYSDPDKDGKQILIKKNVVKRKSINLNDIKSIEEISNDKGKVMKSMCIVEYEGKSIVVKHKYTDLHNLIRRTESASKPIGFIYKKKK